MSRIKTLKRPFTRLQQRNLYKNIVEKTSSISSSRQALFSYNRLSTHTTFVKCNIKHNSKNNNKSNSFRRYGKSFPNLYRKQDFAHKFHTTSILLNNGKGSGGNNNNDDDNNNNSNVNSATTTTTIPIEAALEQPGSDNKKNTLNWLLRLTGYYGDESVNIRQSGAMYQSVLLHSSNNRALDFLGLEDSFYFNHSIIILHVWMLHRRLRSIEIKDLQQDLQEQLFDRVWEDTTKRIRAIGVQELSVNKYVRDAQEFSFGAAWAYDQGLDADDEDALPGALFRNVFRSGEEVDDEKVILLSEYVYSQVEHLDSIRDEDIVSGNIIWLAMPGIDESKNNDAENANWREALSEDGRKYWWNIETRESTWRDPTTSN